MRIEIHIRERDVRGNFVGRRNAFVESCRVYKEAGDSVRMDNMANVTWGVFNAVSKLFAKAWRESKDLNGFLVKLDEFGFSGFATASASSD